MPGVCLVISATEYELHVQLHLDEIQLLEKVPFTPWETGALKIGTSANADAWWSCDDGTIFIGIGHDDQTWTFGVHFPVDRFDDLRAAIADELSQLTT